VHPAHAPLAYTQVLEAKVVVDRPKGAKSEGTKISECLVGDKTGCIIFSARNEQGGGIDYSETHAWDGFLLTNKFNSTVTK